MGGYIKYEVRYYSQTSPGIGASFYEEVLKYKHKNRINTNLCFVCVNNLPPPCYQSNEKKNMNWLNRAILLHNERVFKDM